MWIICDKCGRIASYNSYFQSYMCRQCGNKRKRNDSSEERAAGIKKLTLLNECDIAYSDRTDSADTGSNDSPGI